MTFTVIVQMVMKERLVKTLHKQTQDHKVHRNYNTSESIIIQLHACFLNTCHAAAHASVNLSKSLYLQNLMISSSVTVHSVECSNNL